MKLGGDLAEEKDEGKKILVELFQNYNEQVKILSRQVELLLNKLQDQDEKIQTIERELLQLQEQRSN